MKLAIQLFLLSLIISIFPRNEDNKAVYVEFDSPPMIWLTQSERVHLANSGDPDVREALKKIKEHADSALSLTPDPVDSIHYEGLVSNHPKRIETAEHLQDMIHLRTLTWAYVMTQNREYADKAVEFLSEWASVYKPTGNDVNENKLDICFLAYDVFEKKLNGEDKNLIEEWIKTIAEKQIENWNPESGSSNRHAKRLKLILMASIILEDDSYKDFVDEKTNEMLSYTLYPDGTTRDLKRRDAMHYNINCLYNILELAHVYRVLDVNLYERTTDEGASLIKCVNYVTPYAEGKKIHKEWINTKIEFDRKRWEAGDPFYKPGKQWDPAEAIGMYTLASSFDPVYIELTEKLKKQRGEEINNWLFILAQYAKPHAVN